jgi:hypothetical protein
MGTFAINVVSGLMQSSLSSLQVLPDMSLFLLEPGTFVIESTQAIVGRKHLQLATLIDPFNPLILLEDATMFSSGAPFCPVTTRIGGVENLNEG